MGMGDKRGGPPAAPLLSMREQVRQRGCPRAWVAIGMYCDRGSYFRINWFMEHIAVFNLDNFSDSGDLNRMQSARRLASCLDGLVSESLIPCWEVGHPLIDPSDMSSARIAFPTAAAAVGRRCGVERHKAVAFPSCSQAGC